MKSFEDFNTIMYEKRMLESYRFRNPHVTFDADMRKDHITFIVELEMPDGVKHSLAPDIKEALRSVISEDLSHQVMVRIKNKEARVARDIKMFMNAVEEALDEKI
jgi:hypothetical protein